MARNFQLQDWRCFQFDRARFEGAEKRLLKGSGVVVGSVQHLDNAATQQLVVQLLS